jgi:hypothetical protein
MEDSLATPFHFTEITCPDTGRPIVVKRMLDPIGQLFVTNQITANQRAAAEAYQADLEAPRHRAPSRGPEDVSGWRSSRPGSNGKSNQRLQQVARSLEPDQITLVQAALAGRKVDVRTLTTALDVLAVAYGMSTRPTRH